MSVATLPIIPPTLPSNYCPSTWQQLVNDGVGGAVVQMDITGATVVLKQTTTPTSTQRDYIWYNPDTGHVLTWSNPLTSWVSPHPAAASGYERRIFVGTLTDIETLDGGAAGAVSSISGPFWEQDTAFNYRVPVGVGTFPLSGTAVAVNVTGGADQVTIAQANLPAVKVSVNTAIIGQSGVVGTGSEPVVGSTYGSTALAGSGGACDATDTGVSARYYTKGETDNLGSGTALTNLPPYYGVYIIKRTARQYFVN